MSLNARACADTVAMSPRLTRTGGRIVLLGVLPKGLSVPVEPFGPSLSRDQPPACLHQSLYQTRAAALIASGALWLHRSSPASSRSTMCLPSSRATPTGRCQGRRSPRMTTTSARADVLAAALWMTGAIVSFTTLAVAGRYVAQDLSTFELMLWRSLIGLAIVLAWIAVNASRARLHPRKTSLHLARNVAHFTAQNLWFHAITVLPLATVFALEFTTPIWGCCLRHSFWANG